jgi:short-subunit dehydrogenase
MQQDLEKKYSIKVEIIPSDLSIPDEAQRIYEYLQEKNIFIDHLINNA